MKESIKVTSGASVIDYKICKVVELSSVVEYCRKHEEKVYPIRAKINELKAIGKTPKEIKEHTRKMKWGLPAFTPCVSNQLHGGSVLQSFGLLQIDIDFKKLNNEDPQQAREIKEVFIQSGLFVLVGISASGYGVKALIRTTGGEHKERLQYLSDKIGRKLKNKGFNHFTIDPLHETQACYFPFDSTLYYNEEAPVRNLPIIPKKEAQHDTNYTPSTQVHPEEELNSYGLNMAYNFTIKEYGTLDDHHGRNRFSMLCFKYGISPEEAFDFGERKEPLGIDYDLFLKRWDLQENHYSFGCSRAQVIQAYSELRERQKEHMKKKQG